MQLKESNPKLGDRLQQSRPDFDAVDKWFKENDIG